MQPVSSGDRPERSDFGHLWAAHTASIFGSQISIIAIPLLAIARLDANAFDLSLLTAANLAPYLIAGLFVGVWVDRARKRRLLIAADLGRAVCLLAIPLLVWGDQLTLARLLAITLCHGFLTVVFNVTDVSYLPSLVPRDALAAANARLALSTSVARVSGPAAAGAIVSALAAPFALAINGATYLVSALFIRRIRGGERMPPPRNPEPIRAALTQGGRTLFGIPVLFALVASAGLTSMFGMAFQTLFVLFLSERLGLGAGGIGAMFAIGGAGAVTGSLISGRMLRAIGIGRTILTAQLLFGVAGLILPLALLAPGFAPAIVALSLFVQLGFNTVREVNGAALSQAVIPLALLGRTQSTSLFAIKVLELVGSLGAGLLALTFSTSTAIVLLEIGMFVSIAPLLRSPVRRIASLDDIAPRPHSVLTISPSREVLP